MYVSRLLREGVGLGYAMSLLTSEAAKQSAQYREFVSNIIDDAAISVASSKQLQPGLAAVRLLAQSHTSIVPVLLDGDRWLPHLLLAWPRQRDLIVLCMRVRSDRNARIQDRAKWILIQWIARLKRVQFRRLVGPFENRRGKESAWLGVASCVNDPLPVGEFPTRTAARRTLNIPQNANVLLVAGGIDERKSVPQLIHWLACQNKVAGHVLLLAGPCSPAIRDLISGSVGRKLLAERRLIVIDKFLSEGELREAYAACNAVAVMHENEGPSGALAYAYVAERPVLSWGSKHVTEAVRDHRLGVVIDQREPCSITLGLDRLDGWHTSLRMEPGINTRTGGKFASQILDVVQ
jgi:hypothetical protein